MRGLIDLSQLWDTSMRELVDNVMSSCAQCLHALCILRILRISPSLSQSLSKPQARGEVSLQLTIDNNIKLSSDQDSVNEITKLLMTQ